MKSLKWLALVALLPTVASAAIRNSRHDLSSTSTAAVRANAGQTDQICIFCHTPHNAAATQLLWNHTATAVTTWTWGVTNTTAGTTLPTAPSTLSTRCLSCHDGSIALGSILNSGGAAANFTMTTANMPAGFRVGAAGSMAGHHPVGVPYAGSTYNTLISRARIGVGDYFATQTGAACTGSATGNCTTGGTAGINISLYGTAGGYGIECLSCHDVHNEFSQSYFLRASNAASALCLGCHNK